MASNDRLVSVNDNGAAFGRISGTGLVVLGGLFVSLSPIFVKVSSVGPTMAGFYRTLLGGVILAAIAVVRGEPLWRGRHALKLSVGAAVFFALGLTFWHRSILAIGPGLSSILANLQVFFLAGMAVISLGERISLRMGFAMPIAITGLVLLLGLDRIGADPDYRTGVIYGLAAALAYAFYLMVLRGVQTGKKAPAQLVNFAAISLICAVMMGFEGWMQGESFAINDVPSWLSMIAYGVFCQALAWCLISAGLPRIAASRAGLLLLLSPIGSFLWDILFFRRPTTGLEFLGAGLTVAAIYVGSSKK